MHDHYPIFTKNLQTLPSVDRLLRLELIPEPIQEQIQEPSPASAQPLPEKPQPANAKETAVAVIANLPGQTGSLRIYHALWQHFGCINAAAAQAGLTLYGEHADAARRQPGSHPHIDRLLHIIANDLRYAVRAISQTPLQEPDMQAPVILIGTGEMAGVFARGLLRQGHPLIPVTRQMNMADVATAHPAPALVLVTVGENDLATALAAVPAAWRSSLGLLQNELLPRDWQAHDITNPTVIAVWFEKKKGQDYKVLVPSPIHGPSSALLQPALESLGIPVSVLQDEEQLLFELVRKNLYILTTNIAGLTLPAGTTVETLWAQHRPLAEAVADEVLDIQFRLIDRELPRDRLLDGMVAGMQGDPQHQCTGRSAPARLSRALQQADQYNLTVPRLREIRAAT